MQESKIYAKTRAEQFSDDLYAEDNTFFCFHKVDKIKDHHLTKKTYKMSPTLKQKTITTFVISNEIQNVFVLHFLF